jgi:rhamnulokinase
VDLVKKVCAFDLGASNGRLMLSKFDGNYLEMEEIHRFSNQPVYLTGHFYWDILRIFQEMKNGISKSIQMGHKEIESLGVDTWGVDFGLLSSSGELLGNPYSYRDPQTLEWMSEVFTKISKEELFNRTAVEPSHINTVFQLYAIQRRLPQLIDQTETLLLTPNLVSYLLSGVKVNEFTISTTTQLYNYIQRNWDFELIDLLDIPARIFAPVVSSGTILGPTLGSINRELNIKPIQVIAVAGHDTACALAAMPIKNDKTVFMSCGTWVLMGVQVKEPVVTKDSLEWGFTNEGTLDGVYRLQKNIMGLWLIQQCRVAWSREGKTTSYAEESIWVKEAKPFKSFINPDDPMFFNPENMPNQIRKYCNKTGQSVPESNGEILRCILESLALKYRWVIEKLEQLTNSSLQEIHMGGGGIQNEWLCQFTANATNRVVTAGPVEASAIGNSLAQWIALGEIKDLKEGRKVVEQSFSMKIYEPQNQSEWEEAYHRFVKLL